MFRSRSIKMSISAKEYTVLTWMVSINHGPSGINKVTGCGGAGDGNNAGCGSSDGNNASCGSSDGNNAGCGSSDGNNAGSGGGDGQISNCVGDSGSSEGAGSG
ncbi:unnamed protein product [Macrosiphum euphorbiae]|uniref:Uncharacterized protein n=1 Tax=Macrosiphum euphorbiae TaxID=13131 RepID=A0AAV0WM57_9HEMI|nr:unnamed protein product [Macrosiphum euphorbiae]